jgi:hypothetical protein
MSLKKIVIGFIALAILWQLKMANQWRHIQPFQLELRSQERLIRIYFSSKEPDWRRVPPQPANTFPQKDLLEMPAWYGNSSAVGISPYDFTPRDLRNGERKTRVLFLLDYTDYLQRMNSHFYEM